MGNFFNGAGAVFFRKIFIHCTVILHAVEVVGRMADAVEPRLQAASVPVLDEMRPYRPRALAGYPPFVDYYRA